MVEERKLIKLGNSSFAIALPKDWIDKSGLKKGDKISIVPNSNGELVVMADYQKRNGNNKEINIDIDKKDEKRIERDFISAYMNGKEIFNFSGDITPKISAGIKKSIKKFISCEIVEEKANHLIVKDFLNFEGLSIDNFSKRTDNNIREMLDNLIESVKRGKITLKELDSIKEADADINKIHYLNSRIMSMGLDNPSLINTLNTSTPKIFYNWWLTYNLEHIGDYVKGIAKTINASNKKLESDKLESLFNELKNLYEETIRAFYNNDSNKARELMDLGKVFKDKCNEIEGKDNVLSGLICEKLKSIENSIYQIIKMVVNMELL